jgi:protein-S-isoprenylcysteine O-methyltransferase Ste14
MVTNRFFSATVRIQADRGHVVVDRGPYRYVRHPGYAGALAFTLASPVALGSWRALIPAALTAAVLVLRTALEDRTLRAELTGYREYAGRVPGRLVPGLW